MIAFSKKKAKRKRDEESILLSEMMRLQSKLQTSYGDSLKTELKNKIQAFLNCGVKTRRTIVCSRARWNEHIFILGYLKDSNAAEHFVDSDMFLRSDSSIPVHSKTCALTFIFQVLWCQIVRYLSLCTSTLCIMTHR